MFINTNLSNQDLNQASDTIVNFFKREGLSLTLPQQKLMTEAVKNAMQSLDRSFNICDNLNLLPLCYTPNYAHTPEQLTFDIIR